MSVLGKHRCDVLHAAVLGRKRLFHPLAEGCQLRSRLVDAHARAEPCHDDERVVVAPLREVRRAEHVEGNVQIGRFDRRDGAIVGREHAEQRVLPAVEIQHAPDRIGIGVQRAAPERVARDCHARIALGRCLRIGEHAAELCANIETLEEISRHREARHALRHIAGAQAQLGSPATRIRLRKCPHP